MEEKNQTVLASEAITKGIRIQVHSQYLPERSSPSDCEWFFVYKIQISNESEHEVQLLSRHWYITDGTGRVEEVQGDGVVGKQPKIEPGASFEYASGCPLTTPFGSMYGTYHMQSKAGTSFEAEIARNCSSALCMVMPYCFS